MRGGGNERDARRARGDDVFDGRILGMTPTRRRGAGLRAERRELDKPILMLRNALVLLPQVLHVLELDQDLGLGFDGGGARKTPRREPRGTLHLPRPPVLADASSPHSLHWVRRLPCSQMLEPPHSCSTFAPSRARRSRAPHSLQLCRCLPCSQMLEPPHSAALSLPPVLADARPRLLAPPSLPPVLAALPPPPPCLDSPPPVLADAPSPHSLHWLRCLPCSQMPEPALLAVASLPPVLADAEPPPPCTAPSRARRSLSPDTPCRDTLPNPRRARTRCRWCAPRPRADASRAPAPCRHARSVVTRAPVAALPGMPGLINHEEFFRASHVRRH